MADTTPATQAPPASPTPKANLYTPRGAPNTFGGEKNEKYDIAQYAYPEDLYSNRGEYGGNYAIFYINVSSESKLTPPGGSATVNDMTPRDRGDMVAMGLTATQLAAAGGIVGAVEGGIAGGLFTSNGTKSGTNAQGKKTMSPAGKGALIGGGVGAAVGALVGSQGSRAQKRLKTAIALHIPNNLSINYGVVWNEEDTQNLEMAASIVSGWEVSKGVESNSKNSNVAGVAGDKLLGIATGKALSSGPNAAGNSVATGLAANPKKEQVFKGVNFRTFSFEYKFFPRNSDESKNIFRIIQQFKYHMHPEYKDNNNFVYIYPSEFDIFYYNNGQENMNLHRHTSCVLTDLSVNYTPNGMFNTFSDGMPTQIDITLSFRELALLTKEKIKDGL
jgi:hypothetical protein